MILAGDIGGTKTVLALYSMERRVAGGALHQARYPSGDFESLEAIIAAFLGETGATPSGASFGVAGPVVGRRAQITNLPWTVDADAIAARFGIGRVLLLNDLAAIATAVPHLQDDQLHRLHPGQPPANGNKAVVAPGTGLGIAALIQTKDGFHVQATEAGHSSFAPRDDEQAALLAFLRRRYGHVSFERVCSGKYLPSIFDFLVEQGRHPVPDWLSERLATVDDRTPDIVTTALEQRAEVCVATLDLFVQALGTVSGNIALSYLTSGGLYLGGGIPPRILARLQQPDFLAAIHDKGRFQAWCESVPVSLIMDPSAALHGAAWAAFDAGDAD